MMQNGLRARVGPPLGLALAILGPTAAAEAQHQPIYGGPPYTAGVGGYTHPAGPTLVNDAGTVAGTLIKLNAAGDDLGERALRWNATSAMELPILGTGFGGVSSSAATALNHGGVVAGGAAAFGPSNEPLGQRAMRWSAAGVATALDIPGPTFIDNENRSSGATSAINASNVVVGSQVRYAANGSELGHRPVRWDALGAAQVLQSVTPDTVDHSAVAIDINDAGTIAGESSKVVGGEALGWRALRWDAGSVTPTELAPISAAPDGFSYATTTRILADGTIFGRSDVYDPVTGAHRGSRAVRWDAGSTVAHPLGVLPNQPDTGSGTTVEDANDAGVAVGNSTLHDASGNYLGFRAVRWDPAGNITELDNLGVNANGVAEASALAVDGAGDAVGFASALEGGALVYHAAYWGANGAAVDLNDLIDPVAGWVRLEQASSISDMGWVAGYGLFDPDGIGNADAYTRPFLMQVPEPAGSAAALLLAGAGALLRRRRRGARA